VTEIVPFAFNGTELRTVLIGDQPWFAAADAAKILGYRDAANAVRILRERHRGTHPMSTPGGIQDLTVVSEPGIYRLAMRSDLPAAEDFQDWITDEVLPAIRKTGRYEHPDAAADRPDFDAIEAQSRILAIQTDSKLVSLSEARREAKRLRALAGIGQQPHLEAGQECPPEHCDALLRRFHKIDIDDQGTFSLRDAHRVVWWRDWAHRVTAVEAALAGLERQGHVRRLPGPAWRGPGTAGPRYQVLPDTLAVVRDTPGGTP
jgi:prophage antirepressor-like protein